jgi:methyl-accepting chemotaxis protein
VLNAGMVACGDLTGDIDTRGREESAQLMQALQQTSAASQELSRLALDFNGMIGKFVV